MLNQYSDIMSVSDAAEVLGTGKNRVYKLLKDEEMKGFRIGRVWKIPKQAIVDYILTKSCINPDVIR